MRVGMNDRIINGKTQVCFRQTGYQTRPVPTVQTSPESQVEVGRVEKPMQLRGKIRKAGAQGTLGEEVLTRSGIEEGGALRTAFGIPEK